MLVLQNAMVTQETQPGYFAQKEAMSGLQKLGRISYERGLGFIFGDTEGRSEN